MDCFLDYEGCFYIPFFMLTYIFINLITIDSIEFQGIRKKTLKKSSKIFFLERKTFYVCFIKQNNNNLKTKTMTNKNIIYVVVEIKSSLVYKSFIKYNDAEVCKIELEKQGDSNIYEIQRVELIN